MQPALLLSRTYGRAKERDAHGGLAGNERDTRPLPQRNAFGTKLDNFSACPGEFDEAIAKLPLRQRRAEHALDERRHNKREDDAEEIVRDLLETDRLLRVQPKNAHDKKHAKLHRHRDPARRVRGISPHKKPGEDERIHHRIARHHRSRQQQEEAHSIMISVLTIT